MLWVSSAMITALERDDIPVTFNTYFAPFIVTWLMVAEILFDVTYWKLLKAKREERIHNILGD